MHTHTGKERDWTHGGGSACAPCLLHSEARVRASECEVAWSVCPRVQASTLLCRPMRIALCCACVGAHAEHVHERVGARSRVDGEACLSVAVEFRFTDGGRLRGDSAQMERMYCFHDPAETDDSTMLDVVQPGDRRASRAPWKCAGRGHNSPPETRWLQRPAHLCPGRLPGPATALIACVQSS